MDSERIEQILKENFPADQPEGMRERVLLKAVSELRPAKPRLQPALKLVFAGTLALFILFSNLSDNARRARLTGSSARPLEVYATRKSETANSLQTLTREALAWAGDGTDVRKVKDRL